MECAVLHSAAAAAKSPLKGLTPKARLEAIRRGQVWTRTDVPSMDLRAGPQGPGAFTPNETVRCEYVQKAMSGNSPKFTCAIAKTDDKGAIAKSDDKDAIAKGDKDAIGKGDDKGAKGEDKRDEVKVKYGRDNGEVYGEVAATRLLWALGFGADRMYPVRVVCRGCPPDPK